MKPCQIINLMLFTRYNPYKVMVRSAMELMLDDVGRVAVVLSVRCRSGCPYIMIITSFTCDTAASFGVYLPDDDDDDDQFIILANLFIYY